MIFSELVSSYSWGQCWSRPALWSACSRQRGSKVFLLPNASTTHQRRNLPEWDTGSETCALQAAKVARPQSILCTSSLKRSQRAPVGDPITPIGLGRQLPRGLLWPLTFAVAPSPASPSLAATGEMGMFFPMSQLCKVVAKTYSDKDTAKIKPSVRCRLQR